MEGKLSINTGPQLDDPPFSIPKLECKLQMGKVGLSINGAQFQNVLTVLETFNRMSLSAPYRKYYPFGIGKIYLISLLTPLQFIIYN